MNGYTDTRKNCNLVIFSLPLANLGQLRLKLNTFVHYIYHIFTKEFDFMKNILKKAIFLLFVVVGLTSLLGNALTAVRMVGLVCMVLSPLLICGEIVERFKSPFIYPRFIYEFDITGKRRQNMQDYICKFCNEEYKSVTQHKLSIMAWEIECRENIQKSRFKKLKEHWFESCKVKGEKRAYEFRFVRYYTVRRQRNGVGYVDEEKHITESFFCDYEYLKGLNDKIGVLDIGINEANEIVSIEASE